MTNNLFQVDDTAVLSWIEATYHKTKALPSPKDIYEAYPKYLQSLAKTLSWLDSPKIKRAFDNRGLIQSQNGSPSSSPLTPQQNAAILLVANLTDKRSITAKLKSLGVTSTQWAAWKKQRNFREFLFSQLNDDLDSSLDRAFTGLLSAVDKGDPRALQIYLELTGRQPTENERNFKLAISRLIESITRHVKDPETLRLIAEDFDKIERGMDPLPNFNSNNHNPPVVIEGSAHTTWQATESTIGDSI